MSESGIRMYGMTWCSDCKQAKKFCGEHRVRYEFIDIDEDADGLRVVEEANRGKRIIPTIFFQAGSVLVEPPNADLAAKLGLQTRPECPFYDLVIVGGGPAGLTAALYAAREGIDTLVVERSALGGQAGVTARLDNYPGFPEGISGAEFAERVVQQCRRFGVELLSATEITGIGADGDDQWVDGDDQWVMLASGDEVRSRAVLLRNVRSGESWETRPGGVFVFIGLQPNTGFLQGMVNLDERGMIVTDATLQSSLSGVYAAGDARLGSTKQLVSSAGEGATAALVIREYLERAKVVPARDRVMPEVAA